MNDLGIENRLQDISFGEVDLKDLFLEDDCGQISSQETDISRPTIDSYISKKDIDVDSSDTYFENCDKILFDSRKIILCSIIRYIEKNLRKRCDINIKSMFPFEFIKCVKFLLE